MSKIFDDQALPLCIFMNNRNRKKLLPLILILLAVALVGIFWFKFRSRPQVGQTAGEVSITLNRTFEFIGRDQKGNPTENYLTLTISKATKQDSVTIQGQNAKAKDGKIFLVLDFGVKNDTQRVLYLLPVDLFRLVMNENTKVAPSAHQGLVEVRPVSTKFSNLGFVVDEKQKEFKFEVGEVEGEKQEMTVKF